MKILHHGWTYPNYCKCSDCECEFIYDDNETVSILEWAYGNKPKPLVWTYTICPECNSHNCLYNYKGKINKVRRYYDECEYQEIDFDENTMERR